MSENLKPPIVCDFCDKPADMINHFEQHLEKPRKINVCNSCHSKIHFRLDSKVHLKIIVPKSSVSFFQQFYPKICAANGEIIFDGEEYFKSRYDVVEDSEWQKMSIEDKFPELKKIKEGLK